MSRSMIAVSNRALNMGVMFNGNLTNFTNPPIHTGDLYVVRDLNVGGNVVFNKDVAVTGNLSVTSNTGISGNVDVNGNIHATGKVTASNYAAGQHINTVVVSADDLQIGNITINSGVTNGSVLAYSYTPVYTSSYILVEFRANYEVSGANADSLTSTMTANNVAIGSGRQSWANVTGGGTRSGAVFPIMGRYANSDPMTEPVTFAIKLTTTGSDDNTTIYADGGFWLKITEYGR